MLEEEGIVEVNARRKRIERSAVDSPYSFDQIARELGTKLKRLGIIEMYLYKNGYVCVNLRQYLFWSILSFGRRYIVGLIFSISISEAGCGFSKDIPSLAIAANNVLAMELVDV